MAAGQHMAYVFKNADAGMLQNCCTPLIVRLLNKKSDKQCGSEADIF
jgi:hypothetical protein